MFIVLIAVQNVLELDNIATGTHCCMSVAACWECHIADGDMSLKIAHNALLHFHGNSSYVNTYNVTMPVLFVTSRSLFLFEG